MNVNTIITRAFTIILTAGFSATFMSCGMELPDEVRLAYETLPEQLDYNIHVKPVLSDKCFLCHGPDKNKREAGLRLDDPDAAFAKLENTKNAYAIVAGKPARSQIVRRILSSEDEIRMPTPESKLPLSATEKAIIIKWIEQGAVYQPHWAFQVPKKTITPKVEDPSWNHNPIDPFIWRKLKEKNLQPSLESNKALLLRRLSFDLTGLPPTPKELQGFINDNSSNAYEKQVDRLLASPHFGERLAVDWMDLARYADTHGYQADRYRDMSPWRDWVIQSFNENRPYDQFITWQLAGDLLPDPTREQIIATGFNRLHPQNLEDGIVDEEFRVAYVADRTDVMGQGLLGLTLACAKCHDHKYDPTSQKNYYQLYSFFNNINETGLISWEGATPTPTLMLPTKDQEAIIELIDKQIKKQEADLHLTQVENAETWIEKGKYKSIAYQQPAGQAGTFPKGQIAYFPLDDKQLGNRLNPSQKGKMDRRFSKGEQAVFVKGKNGKGLILDGDAWLDLNKVGIFKRNEPFSIGLQVKLPANLKTGYLFHKGMGTRLHSFRGYHLYLKDNRLELMMAHTWPDNAIVEYADVEIPREEWVQFTVTYDGSSKAAGYRLYMNGEELKTTVDIDNLYKDIIFHDMEDVIYAGPIEPGLQLGARWRGKGIKDAVIDEAMVFDRELTALEVMQIGDPQQFKNIIRKEVPLLTSTDKEMLKTYYQYNFNAAFQKALKQLEKARATYVDSMENIKEVMVMREMSKQRKAYVLERGLYNEYGEEVQPNVPEFLLPMPEAYPKNRLGLGQWITDKKHPLTARVAVNRYWQLIFGRGLVRTTEDFGMQGELPSHPELLDWLAVEFVESDWDVKALLKKMVMSKTYRQDSKASEALQSIDPENIWLARGPALRLTSEMVRDNALMASGLLNLKIGGESVKPYQPEGLYSMNMDPYQQDSGEKLYRRSLYTYWRRTIPHPTLATFDAPERSECTVRRQKTNTPLQALVLMNDPAFVEAAKVMGEDITKAPTLKEGIHTTFVKLTGKEPTEKEIQILLRAQAEEYQAFQNAPRKAKGWLSTGAYKMDKNLEPNLLAANAVIASVIMNSDASITKR